MNQPVVLFFLLPSPSPSLTLMPYMCCFLSYYCSLPLKYTAITLVKAPFLSAWVCLSCALTPPDSSCQRLLYPAQLTLMKEQFSEIIGLPNPSTVILKAIPQIDFCFYVSALLLDKRGTGSQELYIYA